MTMSPQRYRQKHSRFVYWVYTYGYNYKDRTTQAITIASEKGADEDCR